MAERAVSHLGFIYLVMAYTTCPAPPHWQFPEYYVPLFLKWAFEKQLIQKLKEEVGALKAL